MQIHTFANGYELLRSVDFGPCSNFTSSVAHPSGSILYGGAQADMFEYSYSSPMIDEVQPGSENAWGQYRVWDSDSLEGLTDRTYPGKLIKNSSNIFFYTYQVAGSAYIEAFDASFRSIDYDQMRSYGGGSVVVNIPSSDEVYCISFMRSTDNNRIQWRRYQAKLDINYLNERGRDNFAIASDVKSLGDAIAISDTEILVVGDKFLCKIATETYYDEDTNSYKYTGNISKTTKKTANYTQTQIIDMKNGTYLVFGYNEQKMITITKIDSNLNILSEYTSGFTMFMTKGDGDLPPKFACLKNANTFYVVGYQGYDVYMLEMDTNYNIKSQDVISLWISTSPVEKTFIPTIREVKMEGKNIQVLYTCYNGWDGKYHTKMNEFKPIPPNVTISTNITRIGDNTPIRFSINATGPYTYLYIYDVTNNLLIQSGDVQDSVMLNLDFQGDKTIMVKILDTDLSILNTSNSLVFNKRNMLNQIYLVANTENGMQKFIVIDDIDRYYENNVENQKLVADIKAKTSCTFLIYNDVSDVLIPLLSP